MTQPPSNPKIYYITPVDNLPKIAEAGCGWHTLKYGGRENRQSTFAMEPMPIAVASSLLTSLCSLPSPPWARCSTHIRSTVFESCAECLAARRAEHLCRGRQPSERWH